ncbi:hypothetical protein CR512_13245 [Pseudomonas putida]|nr:hypothetical protein CR512_13245 [Pseudomonas putida]
MLDHKLRSLKSSVKSSLRLAVHPAYGNFLAPMAIARFRQKLDVPVFFEVCSSASAYQRVHSGEIDFGIDGICDITLESRVLGGASYASGVSKIVSSAMTNQLENRTYLVDEFVTNRWI